MLRGVVRRNKKVWINWKRLNGIHVKHSLCNVMRHHYERLTMWLTYDWIYIDFCMTCDQMDNFSVSLLNFLVRIYNVLSYLCDSWYISWIHLSSMRCYAGNAIALKYYPELSFSSVCVSQLESKKNTCNMTSYKNSMFIEKTIQSYTMIRFSDLCLPKEVNLNTVIVTNILLVIVTTFIT